MESPGAAQLLVELTAPPGMTKVATSHGTVRIIVTAMAVAPFIVCMEFAFMLVAVIAGVSAARDGTGVVAPHSVILAAPPIMGKTHPR